MTFSGRRRPRYRLQTNSGRSDAAGFVGRLARTTKRSINSILREARRLGYRIGNDLGRGLINAARNRTVTSAQTQRIANYVQRNIDRINDPRLRQLTLSRLSSQRVSITVNLTGRGRFLWEKSQVYSETEANAELNQTFIIRADQIENFFLRFDDVFESMLPQLTEKAAVSLDGNANYGEIVMDNITANIVRLVSL